jgi:CelD/BcsL family acetyltransferase involved in cellulose biosynthesis
MPLLNLNDDIQAEIVTDESRLLAIKPHWQQLFRESCNPASVLRWEWHWSWLQTCARHSRGAKQRLVALWRRGELTAVLPLWEQRLFPLRRRLLFMSAGSTAGGNLYPEYLDALCSRAHRPAVVTALGHLLFELRHPSWDLLTFDRLREGAVLAETAARFPNQIPLGAMSECALFVDLRPGFEAYLGSRGRSVRSRLRRCLRASGGAALKFEIADSREDNLVFLDQLITLHQRRWRACGQRGAFPTRPIVAFHRALLQQLSPPHEVALSRISNERGPLAILYGFISGGRYEFYQSAIAADPPAEVKSPGILLHLLTMEALARRGIETYDFLAGKAEYKSQMATGEKELNSYTFSRRGLPALSFALGTILDRARLRARGIVRRLSPTLLDPS